MSKLKLLMPTGETVTAEMPQWKTPYNHDTNLESDRTAIYCHEPSLTKQEFAEEADINVILERFTKSGEPPPQVLPEHFTDLTGRRTYFDMQTQIATANVAFYNLPASLRAEHLNDPARWADAVIAAVETGNREKLDALGVDATKPPQEANLADPPSPGTPGVKSGQAPPEEPKTGAPAPEKSDPPK